MEKTNNKTVTATKIEKNRGSATINPKVKRTVRGEVKDWWGRHREGSLIGSNNFKFNEISLSELNSFFAGVLNKRDVLLDLKTSGNGYDRVVWAGPVSRPLYKWFTEDLNLFHLLEQRLTNEEKKQYEKFLQEKTGLNENLLYSSLNDRIQPMFEVLKKELPKEVNSTFPIHLLDKDRNNEDNLISPSNPVKENTIPVKESIQPFKINLVEIKKEELEEKDVKNIPVQDSKFKTGSKVKWSSQASGFVKTKQGVILKVVQPHTPVFDFSCIVNGSKIRVKDTGSPRNHISYIVLVSFSDGSKSKLYWPLASKLELDSVDLVC